MNKVSYFSFAILFIFIIFVMSISKTHIENMRSYAIDLVLPNKRSSDFSKIDTTNSQLALENQLLHSQIEGVYEWLSFEERIDEQVQKFKSLNFSSQGDIYLNDFFRRRSEELKNVLEEQLQSEMDLFNDTYEPQAQRAMMLDEMLSKEHQRQTRHIPSRKLEKIKPSDIHNSTTRTITHSRSHRPRQRKQTTQSTSTAKKTTKSKVDDNPSVVNMNVMYDDGIQDIIPVDESIRDLIIDFQDGFNY